MRLFKFFLWRNSPTKPLQALARGSYLSLNGSNLWQPSPTSFLIDFEIDYNLSEASTHYVFWKWLLLQQISSHLTNSANADCHLSLSTCFPAEVIQGSFYTENIRIDNHKACHALDICMYVNSLWIQAYRWKWTRNALALNFVLNIF